MPRVKGATETLNASVQLLGGGDDTQWMAKIGSQKRVAKHLLFLKTAQTSETSEILFFWGVNTTLSGLGGEPNLMRGNFSAVSLV